MADICVLYLSDDERVANELVALLRSRWSVWYAGDIPHGSWEQAVRSEIPRCQAVVPVLSEKAAGPRSSVLKDEMRFAFEQEKPVLPLIVGRGEIPFGFGDLNRTEALNWVGEPSHPGIVALISKLSATLGMPTKDAPRNPRNLRVGNKTLELPAFVFSLSSFETRLRPDDGLVLLSGFEPTAALVSAYDVYRLDKNRARFARAYRDLSRSRTSLFLDSGNYEASRQRDYYDRRRNRDGWKREHFREIARKIPADITFHFDRVDPRGEPATIVRQIVRDYRADARALEDSSVNLCPIVHLPAGDPPPRREVAARIVAEVAAELRPRVLAIPERELGEGIIQRARTVQLLRQAIDDIDPLCVLHLLGTGNPLSMAAFAAAGADLFDGLEWCRTVADYPNARLYHFQHFDAFRDACLSNMRDPRMRSLVEDDSVPYTTRALAYNLDFFEDWARSMRSLIRGGNQKTLLGSIPNIGASLYDELFGRE